MDKEVLCPLCGSRNLDFITGEVRFGNQADIYKCVVCGLTFLDQDSFDFPEGFYEKDYHQTYITHVEPDALNPQAYFNKMRKATGIWADKFRHMLSGQEVVLDVGCSTGHFIDLIKDKTRITYGFDLNRREVDFCKNKLNFNVSDRPLDERFEEGTFDYITMIFVLEHIAQPKEFLSALKKFLKPEGKFVILVPNIQDALVNFYDIPEFRSFYYCIEHVFYYNQDTIRRLFDDVGLEGEIEVIQEYPITNHLNWGYRRAPSDTLASRRGVPDVPLADKVMVDSWEELWNKFNQLYKAFLKANGYGDRVWCTVGTKQ